MKKKELSKEAKYLWKLLDHYWGRGLTLYELCNEWGYSLEEIHPLIKELKSYMLVKDYTEYYTLNKGYRAEFDRKELIDGKD